MADGSSSNCTVGVGNITPYISSFDSLDITDQVENPAGSFNITQLHNQAITLPYVMTDLLMNRNDVMMLYENVLPGYPVPDLSFLNDTIPTPSPTSDIPPTSSSDSDTLPTLSATSDTQPSTSTTSVITPSITPGADGGGAAATISFSLCITVVALLFAIVL